MLVSVVIPTKDRPVPVYGAVRSVFDGTYQNFELFVIDQSADDATRDALFPFAEDPRFHYRRNTRAARGGASSRNVGIALSAGEIVATTDDDVTVDKNWLANMVKEFEADPVLQFLCGKVTAPPHDRSANFIPDFDTDYWSPQLTDWTMPFHISGGNFSMRRDLFDRVGGYDESFVTGTPLNCEDGDIGFRIMRAGAKWKVSSAVEVEHTHSFYNRADGAKVINGYSLGTGAAYGRYARRGDVYAGLWFLQFQMREMATIVARSLVRRQRPRGLGWIRWRLVGFWRGLLLPPRQGFVTGADLARMREQLLREET